MDAWLLRWYDCDDRINRISFLTSTTRVFVYSPLPFSSSSKNAASADICRGGGGDDRIDGGTAPGTTAGLKNTVAGHQGNDVILDPIAEINGAFTFNFNLLLM